MDLVPELKNFDFNENWNLFPCSCGYRTSKSRRALNHLKEDHSLELQDDDIHIKIKARFICHCGNIFTSKMASIIYQNQMLRRMRMDCGQCGASVVPTIVSSQRVVSDNVLALVCRWKLTMKLIPKKYSGSFKFSLDHVRDKCEACKMKICENRNLINYDPNNFLHIKKFDRSKHQIASKYKTYDIYSIADTINSGATSIL